MILNIDAFPYLYSSSWSEIRKFSNLTNILNLDPEKNYWYIEFLSGDSLKKSKDFLPPEILDNIRQGKVILILANIHEAFHSVVSDLYEEIVNNLKIPEKSIIFVSESADVDKVVDAVSKDKGKEPIKVKWARIFEYNVHTHIKRNINKNITLEEKHYNKKFLNFNRRWRLHRPLFVSLLCAKNLLDKGFVSMAPSDDRHSWSTIFPMLTFYNDVPFNSAYPEIIKLLNDNKEKILNLPPLYLDIDDLTVNQAELSSTTDQFYRDSYFSVVGETNFYTTVPGFEPGRFLSEKTFKPIYNKHPFLILSPPNTLDLLRRLGYQTFSPYINERYDIEPNDFKRMLMIIEEVGRLSNLTTNELTEFLNGVRPICEYNFNHLKNKNYKTDFSTWLIQ